MLVSAKDMLEKAKAGHYAVGQFNINNLEWTKSVLLTAQELQSPVILGVSEGAGKYMTGFGTVAAMVKAMDESLGITVPVHPSCSMVLIIRLKRISQRPRSS
jgi:fructose-bisphosphate aldolase class II